MFDKISKMEDIYKFQKLEIFDDFLFWKIAVNLSNSPKYFSNISVIFTTSLNHRHGAVNPTDNKMRDVPLSQNPPSVKNLVDRLTFASDDSIAAGDDHVTFEKVYYLYTARDLAQH